MSSQVFPSLPGLRWDITRTPIWKTTVRESVSGREYRFTNYSYPRYEYKLSFDVLRQTTGYTEMATLAGFFNTHRGSQDSFLFTDPDDYSVTAQNFGTGNASATQFQLVRVFGGFTEPVYDTNGAPAIYANGALQSTPANYSINSTGLVTFTSAPASGANLTWTGSFYRRVRFVEDQAELRQFMSKLWELGEITLLSTKP